MKFSDSGIIVNLSQFQDSGLIVSLLSESHGLVKALSKNANSKKNAAAHQIGNEVKFEWFGRNVDSLGVVSVEVLDYVYGKNALNKHAVTCLIAMCEIISNCVPEKDVSFSDLFTEILAFFKNIHKVQDSKILYKKYLLLELGVLKHFGFGLDLACCVVTGSANSLEYISPKTGCAVSGKGAVGYEAKLLPFPKMFQNIDREEASQEDLLKACAVNLHFLRKCLNSLGKNVCVSRAILQDRIKQV